MKSKFFSQLPEDETGIQWHRVFNVIGEQLKCNKMLPPQSEAVLSTIKVSHINEILSIYTEQIDSLYAASQSEIVTVGAIQSALNLGKNLSLVFNYLLASPFTGENNSLVQSLKYGIPIIETKREKLQKAFAKYMPNDDQERLPLRDVALPFADLQAYADTLKPGNDLRYSVRQKVWYQYGISEKHPLGAPIEFDLPLEVEKGIDNTVAGQSNPPQNNPEHPQASMNMSMPSLFSGKKVSS